MKCPECGSKDIKATEYKLTGGWILLSTFFVRFYAISGVCTQKCASCDCINFLVIMKVSHHGSKASLGNSFVLILYNSDIAFIIVHKI